jgi:hypothetical protein
MITNQTYHVLSLVASTTGSDLEVLKLDPRLGKIIDKVNYKHPKAVFLAKAIRSGWTTYANHVSRELYNDIINN